MTSATRTIAACHASVAGEREGRANRIRVGFLSRPVVFQNPGIIDLAAVTTMGVSVKDGDEPIGYFGTGLKFAIATVLREGGIIVLYRGTERHDFTLQTIEVRGQEFQQVCLDGRALGFTTKLGRDWEPWMAFRELASNCRDEGGHYFIGDDWTPREGFTTIAVKCAGVERAHAERRDILLEAEPLARLGDCDIHPGPSAYAFYRGVRIYTLHRPSAMRYDIKSPIDLTEDRTAKWGLQVQARIAAAIQELTNDEMLRTAMTCGEAFFEHHLDLSGGFAPSPEFVRMSNTLAMGAESIPNANPSAVSAARKRSIAAMKEGDGMLLSTRENMMLDRAKKMLATGGFDMGIFPLICTETLGPGIMGLAQDGKIFIARDAFNKGTRELAATLLEEFAHLKSGQDDCTRGFQNWLFDQILIKTEDAVGEPF